MLISHSPVSRFSYDPRRAKAYGTLQLMPVWCARHYGRGRGPDGYRADSHPPRQKSRFNGSTPVARKPSAAVPKVGALGERTCSTEVKRTNHSTGCYYSSGKGRVTVGLRTRIGWKWTSSRELFKRGRQNSTRFRSDQCEKRGIQLVNERRL